MPCGFRQGRRSTPPTAAGYLVFDIFAVLARVRAGADPDGLLGALDRHGRGGRGRPHRRPRAVCAGRSPRPPRTAAAPGCRRLARPSRSAPAGRRQVRVGYGAPRPLDLQRDALRAAGVDDAVNLYHDLASGVRDDRPRQLPASPAGRRSTPRPRAAASCSASSRAADARPGVRDVRVRLPRREPGRRHLPRRRARRGGGPLTLTPRLVPSGWTRGFLRDPVARAPAVHDAVAEYPRRPRGAGSGGQSERPRLDHRRAAILNDQPASGDYTAGNTGTVGRIGRAGLADFLVGQVKDDAWRKQAVSVTSRPGSGVPVTATAPSECLRGAIDLARRG